MCDTGFAIYEQARTLDPADDKICNASFTVLATPKVFEHFLKLNPSIVTAIKQHAAGRRTSPHRAPTEISPPRPQTAMGAAQFAHMQRRSNGIQPTQHRSHVPPDQIGRMGGGLARLDL